MQINGQTTSLKQHVMNKHAAEYKDLTREKLQDEDRVQAQLVHAKGYNTKESTWSTARVSKA